MSPIGPRIKVFNAFDVFVFSLFISFVFFNCWFPNFCFVNANTIAWSVVPGFLVNASLSRGDLRGIALFPITTTSSNWTGFCGSSFFSVSYFFKILFASGFLLLLFVPSFWRSSFNCSKSSLSSILMSFSTFKLKFSWCNSFEISPTFCLSEWIEFANPLSAGIMSFAEFISPFSLFA